MKATIPYVEEKFEEFNRQMFAGQLPSLPIELSDAKTFLGVCVFKKRKVKWNATISNFESILELIFPNKKSKTPSSMK